MFQLSFNFTVFLGEDHPNAGGGNNSVCCVVDAIVCNLCENETWGRISSLGISPTTMDDAHCPVDGQFQLMHQSYPVGIN